MATIKKSVHPSRLPGLPGALLALGLSLCASLPAFGAATDIASGPLAQPATSVKPNMLMILDDSGSMVSVNVWSSALPPRLRARRISPSF